MDNIKLLEEIGLKKVSDATHIEQKYLKYMVDCDFDKLNRINTLGFVKILSREYNLNLDNWVAAFEEYWQENRVTVDEDDIFTVMNSGKKSKKLYIVVLLMVFGSLVFFAYSIFAPNFTSKPQIVSFVDNSKILEEVNNTLEEIDKKTEVEEEPKEEAVVGTMPKDENIQEIKEEIIKDTPAVIPEANISEKNSTQIDITSVPKTEFKSDTFSTQAVIHPKSELWIGVIYLDDFSRRSFLGENNFSIGLSRDQIITTGHGSFSLKADQGDMEYSRQSPIRFEILQGHIKEIDLSRFKELNKGNTW